MNISKNQPAGDIFVAEITEVGCEVGADGAGSGYAPHAWIEKRETGSGRAYVDDEIGRSGTTTVHPAFDINGAVYAVGTKVFMRLRAWSGVDVGTIYDIIAPASAIAGAIPQCTTTTTIPPGCGANSCTWTWDNSLKIWTTASSCPVSCSCQYPSFCGSLVCQIVSTYCALSAGTTTTTPNCLTTTTPTPPVTTTTTPDPLCNGRCRWMYVGTQWIAYESSCFHPNPFVCYCINKPTGAGSQCEIRQGGCGTTTTTAACSLYSRSCRFDCVPGTGWVENSPYCPSGCCCVIPQEKCCYSWQVIYSWCMPTNMAGCGAQPSPLCGITTTTSGGTCSGSCSYTCLADGLTYGSLVSTCVGSCAACLSTINGPCTPGAPFNYACSFV